MIFIDNRWIGLSDHIIDWIGLSIGLIGLDWQP